MKTAKWFFAALALLGLSLQTLPVPAQDSGLAVCGRSNLCIGLANEWEFAEVSDSVRIDKAGGRYAYEPDAANVSRSTTQAWSVSGYSLDLNGSTSKYLDVPNYGGLGSGEWTVSIALRYTTAPASGSYYHLVNKYPNPTAPGPTKPGPMLLIKNEAGGGECGGTAGVYAALWVQQVDGSTKKACVSGTPLSANTWYLIHAGMQLWNIGQANAWVSVNAGTRATAALTDYLTSYQNANLRIGANQGTTVAGLFVGQLDELTIWNRSLSTTDVSIHYNSGGGMIYPFFSN